MGGAGGAAGVGGYPGGVGGAGYGGPGGYGAGAGGPGGYGAGGYGPGGVSRTDRYYSDRDIVHIPGGEIDVPRSIPFPSGGDFDGAGYRGPRGVGGGGQGGHQININENIDVSALEGTLQQLLGKIERLESERVR